MEYKDFIIEFKNKNNPDLIIPGGENIIYFKKYIKFIYSEYSDILYGLYIKKSEIKNIFEQK